MTKIGRDLNFFFSYNSATLNVGTFDLTAAFQFFADTKINYLPAVCKHFAIGPGDLTTEITYNYRENIPMFVAGYKVVF